MTTAINPYDHVLSELRIKITDMPKMSIRITYRPIRNQPMSASVLTTDLKRPTLIGFDAHLAATSSTTKDQHQLQSHHSQSSSS